MTTTSQPRDCFPCSEHDRPNVALDVTMTALSLWDSWKRAQTALDGTDRRDHDEQTALDALVDYVEANGLNGSKFDPRPTEVFCPRCGGSVQVWADESGGVTINFACDDPSCLAGKGPWSVERPTEDKQPPTETEDNNR